VLSVRNLAAFALMSLIWGLTWAAIKIGLAAAPPLFLAAARYLIAAAVLAFLVRGDRSAFVDGRAPRTILTALLVNVCTHALLFWGMQHVASGLAGLINLALIPVMLFALAALTGEQRAGWRHAIALAIGCAGLVGLFWTRLGDGRADGLGMAAVVAATACYCIGSILARPLVGPVRPMALTFAQAAIGGAVLLALSLALEPVTGATLAGLAMPRVIASLLFLSLLGTVIAYTIYLVLIREWGTVRAGLYAFVSPIVALAVGAGLFGEAIGRPEIAGALLLLAAAAIALAPRRETGSG